MLWFIVLITKTQMCLNLTDNPTVNLLNPIRPFYRPLHSIKLLLPVNLRRPAQNICPPVYLEFINVTVTGQEMTLIDRPVHASLPSEWREQEVQGAGDNMWAHDALKDQLSLFYSPSQNDAVDGCWRRFSTHSGTFVHFNNWWGATGVLTWCCLKALVVRVTWAKLLHSSGGSIRI